MQYNRSSQLFLVQGEYKTNGGDADGDDWLLLDSDERKVQDDQEEYIAPPLTVSLGCANVVLRAVYQEEKRKQDNQSEKIMKNL
jgi:hypothetical protein